MKEAETSEKSTYGSHFSPLDTCLMLNISRKSSSKAKVTKWLLLGLLLCETVNLMLMPPSVHCYVQSPEALEYTRQIKEKMKAAEYLGKSVVKHAQP